LDGMPQYYRHIQQGGNLIQDPDGVELPNLDAARTEALDGIRDILAACTKRGEDDALDDVIVIDEAGQELLTIPFPEALPQRLHQALPTQPDHSRTPIAEHQLGQWPGAQPSPSKVSPSVATGALRVPGGGTGDAAPAPRRYGLSHFSGRNIPVTNHHQPFC
jgi:hypothetical protein